MSNYYELVSSLCTHLPGEVSACMHAPRHAARAGISAPFHKPEKIVHVIDLKTVPVHPVYLI